MTHRARRRTIKAGLGLAFAFLTLFGWAAILEARTATPPPAGQRIYDMQWLTINKWRCPFYNDGRYGIDITVGSGVAGGSWPQPYKNMYIFGAGLWFGSLKHRPGTEKIDTLVTFGYNPNSGGTEMTPVLTKNAEGGAGSPDDRIYKYPENFPPPLELRERFGTGNPSLDSLLIPYENFSLQDMWCCYSDAAPENHISPGKPQGIDIYQTVYAWNYPTNQDIFFIIYQIRNSGTDTLKRCYAGAVMDPDIGAAPDDMVGLMDSVEIPGVGLVRNVGYAGDNDNYEAPSRDWESGTPGVFAYKFLESPKRPDGRQLGMTAFKKFTIDIDPVTDPAQYLTMAGYDYRTGVYAPYDSQDVAPADKRFIQCSGPFDLAPGEVARLVVAGIGARFGGPNQPWADRGRDSLVHLARVANTAQFIYDQGWLLPGPPLAPNLTLVPGDNQVRIVWDNLPEKTPDPYWVRVVGDPGSPNYDPKYRGYDFQGYVIYKSRNGVDWKILGQCDLVDDVPLTDSVLSFPPGNDSTLPDSLWIKMRNSGTYYSLDDKDVVNGFKYYYCVTAYDWNYVTTQRDSAGNPVAWDTLILRSGLVSNFTVVPRWEPANYVNPTTSIQMKLGRNDKPNLTCSTYVVAPANVTNDVYQLVFDKPIYGGAAGTGINKYWMVNVTRGEIVDSGAITYTVGSKITRYLPVFNGQSMRLVFNQTAPQRIVDTVYIESGSYPPDRPRAGGTSSQAYWAYRGSDYRVRWDNSNGYLTAKIWDASHTSEGDTAWMQFTRFDGLAASRDKADGWCFVNLAGRNPTDTLKGSVYSLYVGGGYVTLNYNSTTGRPDSVGALVNSIQAGDVWLLKGSSADYSAAYLNRYEISSTAGKEDTSAGYQLNVKVVPNPYIVFNAWEKRTDERVVRFTHLPSQCVIRIYTTSGDLVKTINHTATPAGGAALADGGTATWDFTNDSGSAKTSGQLVASGVYVWHVESPVGEAVGKLVFIH